MTEFVVASMLSLDVLASTLTTHGDQRDTTASHRAAKPRGASVAAIATRYETAS